MIAARESGLVDRERATAIYTGLLDRLATRWVEECDVFHFESAAGLRSARKAKRLGAALVCDVRQEHPSFQRRILREEAERLGMRVDVPGTLYEDRVLEEFGLADYLVVPSEYARRTFLEVGFRAEQVLVLRYGVDAELFRPKLAPASRFRVLFCGQITFRKGIPYLLQAFSELALPGAELVLIGPVDPQIEPVLATYAGCFRHVPAVPKADLPSWYASGSVLALPSLADAFPLVVLEAMACGLPAIVTTNTGSTEVVANRINGFVVGPRDVEGLKETLLFAYENRDTLEDIGRAAAQTALEMTWRQYRRGAEVLYRSIESSLGG